MLDPAAAQPQHKSSRSTQADSEGQNLLFTVSYVQTISSIHLCCVIRAMSNTMICGTPGAFVKWSKNNQITKKKLCSRVRHSKWSCPNQQPKLLEPESAAPSRPALAIVVQTAVSTLAAVEQSLDALEEGSLAAVSAWLVQQSGSKHLASPSKCSNSNMDFMDWKSYFVSNPCWQSGWHTLRDNYN